MVDFVSLAGKREKRYAPLGWLSGKQCGPNECCALLVAGGNAVKHWRCVVHLSNHNKHYRLAGGVISFVRLHASDSFCASRDWSPS